MANEFLRLPAGLTEADYPVADNLLDFTPTTIGWNPPLAPTGENIFANYIKAYPDLLKDYNRKLARPLGSPGSLPVNKYGAPISMAEFGYDHWSDAGQTEGRTLTKAPGVWGDPGRSPYLPYFYPGKSIEIEEDFTEEQIEEAQAINEAVTQAGTSQVITGGGTSPVIVPTTTTSTSSVTTDDDPTTSTSTSTVQDEFIKEVEEEAEEPAYPFGHTTASNWNMDPRNQWGSYWALSIGDPSYVWDWGAQRWTKNGAPLIGSFE